MIFQHTRDMEGTVRALASRFERVLIRNKNILWNPIRFRRRKIADLKPRIVLNSQAWDSQLQEWNVHGGLMIYDRSFRLTENIAAHQAQIVIECPLSVEELLEYAAGTRELAVVYAPPHWREHERCVNTLFPNGELCKRFDMLVQAAPECGECSALKLPPCTAITDEDVSEMLGVTSSEMWRVRSSIYRKRDFNTITRVMLRHPPDDRTLAAVYEAIERFPEVEGVHLILGNGLGKATRYWKQALRDLARRGAINLLDTLYCYFPPEVPINWRHVDAARERAWRRFEEVRSFVEALPEFNPLDWTRLPALEGQAPASSCASS